MEEIDFTATIANNAVFDNCELKGAIFEATNLEKSDFRTALHFEINPENNRLKGTRFSRNTIEGAVSQYQIIIE